MVLLFAALHAWAAEYGPTLEGDLVPSEVVAEAALDTGVVASCSDQWLENGVQLPDLPLFYTRITPDGAWGTPEMVDTIIEASRHMRWLMPEASPLVVGDISNEHGGFMHGHMSHRGGVDADIGLYSKGGKQARGQFVNPGDDFDVVANWALVSALLETGNIEFILLDQSHINRLRAYTLKAGLLTPEEAEEIFPTGGRLWERSGYLRHAPNHHDHFHIRVTCSDGSRAGG